MAYDDGFGQQPLGPGGCVPTTNTTTFALPPKAEPRVLTGARIFRSVKKANKFMDDAIVEEVDIVSHDDTLLIVVYYQVGEDFDA